jgi:predicted nucleic acid-binding protein
MACLDTTILVDLSAGSPRLKKRALEKIAQLAERGETLVTTRFNVAELLVGVARAADPAAEKAAVKVLLDYLEVLEFDGRSAELFGEITAHLQKSGKPAGDMDVLIAATALAAGHGLVTRNAAHFANIPALNVEDY